MYMKGKIIVNSAMPDRISGLKEIAYNLWWTWNMEVLDLFRMIDDELWSFSGGNPVKFLNEVSFSKLEKISGDHGFLEKYDLTFNKYKTYINDENTWFHGAFPRVKNRIGYFSAEFGLHEILPIYSGGLGVLSGDHLKSASDMGIPLTAVGIFYRQGYFNQHINKDGYQETKYPDLELSDLPLLPVLDQSGNQLVIKTELPGRTCFIKVWKVNVGRVTLYLIDSNTLENDDHDRWLTARLYGGDQETRIQQEILLGMGGFRVLDALDLTPDVYHINEGHSAFLGLELIRKLMNTSGLTFEEAREAAKASLVFTTHTPVPAGNDVFPSYMMEKYFSSYWQSINISREDFLNLGHKEKDTYNFNMTILALTLSGHRNGVSMLHGKVTRGMFSDLWPGLLEDEVPIGHVTNGIHTLTWISKEFKGLFDKYLNPDWTKAIHVKDTWLDTDKIPDEELWEAKQKQKLELVMFLKDRIRQRLKINSIYHGDDSDSFPDPEALTIGFARRFATYKRAGLIFRDIERIKRLLNKKDMPVQIIFAGKAHPADIPAQDVIKQISDISNGEGFKGKVFIIEDYNISIARKLVQGVDIWLNNPRKPQEASGTSGQKVCVNGILNFSVRDGWWAEGYNGLNGFSIGDDRVYENEHALDDADSISLYNTLENVILPLFFQRDERGIPSGWLQMVRESIKSLSYKYSTDRMLKDYTTSMYMPAMEKSMSYKNAGYEPAKVLMGWKRYLNDNWHNVAIHRAENLNTLKEYHILTSEELKLHVSVNLGGLTTEDVKVELCYGPSIGHGKELAYVSEMKPIGEDEYGSMVYETVISPNRGGEYSYTFRILPYHPYLQDKFDPKLVKWIV